MSNNMLDLLNELKQRGYIHQCTDYDKLSTQELVKGYIGFDCTAKSLHVGSLIQIMLLRKLQQYGHKPIVLFGGGTTQIGDPSGKDESRKLLSKSEIQDNKKSLGAVFSRFIDFGDSSTGAIMVDNAEWLEELNYIEFLREYGRHFSVNRMLSFDSVRLRLEREQNLTFLEFNYMLLQAYDFVELYKRFGCKLQMGGSDQWGNIVSGVDLSRRLGLSEVFGLTSPLLTTSSGVKMGKTANGAVWLNRDMLKPYDYWQFWRNTEDDDVEKFLLLFTELPVGEIKRLGALKGKELNEAKIILANEATTLCHGKDAANSAHETALRVFSEGDFGDNLPTFTINAEDIDNGIPLFRLLALSDAVESGKAAKRLIQGGAVRLNNQLVSDEMQNITKDIISKEGAKISLGKKKHIIIKLHQ